ncbi:hypothetical protein TeGR_g9634, partial [Tetraparma gracilis]
MADEWFYVDDSSQQVGPIPVPKLREDYKNKVVDDDTFFWKDGQAEWLALADIPALKAKLKPPLPPAPGRPKAPPLPAAPSAPAPAAPAPSPAPAQNATIRRQSMSGRSMARASGNANWFKTINQDMNDFFEDNCDKFEQDFDDYQKQGETLEQYSCYTEYKKALEEKLDVFVANENFDDEEECLLEIQRLVQEDLARNKAQMEKIMKNLLKAQKAAIKAIRRAQAQERGELDNLSSSEEEEEEEEKGGGGDDGGLPSMMVFFQPTTLEQLVDMVMNLGEYQTFSMMMRMKVQQKRVMKLLMEARDGEGPFAFGFGGG